MSAPPPPLHKSGAGRRIWPVVAVLLAIPIVAPLLVNTYARDEPELAGFPFYFWYQFLWIPVASLLTFICFRLVSRQEQRDREEGTRR
jgi:hypothetical protein